MRHTYLNRFIKWTQETFSAGGHKAELLPLLERCTRELQAGRRYDSDIRYLRVWVQYVSDEPTFLHSCSDVPGWQGVALQAVRKAGSVTCRTSPSSHCCAKSGGLLTYCPHTCRLTACPTPPTSLPF